ncbi:SigE family RNA polymerase sigma factor [Nocardioides sp. B-3]|uniref:SigE family RNA polymerase sigma factor n=1 Tax=Nocardioides sp. B-3 TaxID=2895565 RepID=UPI0021539693|nr:SigE family RNA polymerase sigma factor [Nocardioides sp. B-3]UUZ58569.1 SigE family RNA polymerase sigma factor [Nocardioides sp. B-3]
MSTAEAGFTEWLVGHRTSLLRGALLLTGDRARAEDSVQEATLKVAQRWHRLHDQHPTAYARKIIYRDHVSGWRRRREFPTDVAHDVPGYAHDPDHRAVVLAAPADLPQRQRAVVVLRYFEDLTERQTADVLGIAVGTVKSRAHDALRSLRSVPSLHDLIGEERSR